MSDRAGLTRRIALVALMTVAVAGACNDSDSDNPAAPEGPAAPENPGEPAVDPAAAARFGDYVLSEVAGRPLPWVNPGTLCTQWLSGGSLTLSTNRGRLIYTVRSTYGVDCPGPGPTTSGGPDWGAEWALEGESIRFFSVYEPIVEIARGRVDGNAVVVPGLISRVFSRPGAAPLEETYRRQ
jgi:hypothetical protein